MDGIVGARIFPARWFGFGLAYRDHFNEQDTDSFDDDSSPFSNRVLVNCNVVNQEGGCTPAVFTNTSTGGIPNGFLPSSDPHGFIVQVFAGRRNKRQAEVVNLPPNVTALTVSDQEITLGCAAPL